MLTYRAGLSRWLFLDTRALAFPLNLGEGFHERHRVVVGDDHERVALFVPGFLLTNYDAVVAVTIDRGCPLFVENYRWVAAPVEGFVGFIVGWTPGRQHRSCGFRNFNPPDLLRVHLELRTIRIDMRCRRQDHFLARHFLD